MQVALIFNYTNSVKIDIEVKIEKSDNDDTPPLILEAANKFSEELIPQTSLTKYNLIYSRFIEWQKSSKCKKVASESEMEGFDEVDAGEFIPSSREVEYEIEPTNREVYLDLDSKRFSEIKHYKLDRLEYSRNGTEPGLVIIFNLETFEGSIREGSSMDVENIVTCLSRLGFNINPQYILTDPTKEEIFTMVSKILESDLSQFNSVLVFVLTHGGSANNLDTTTGKFLADELFDQFNKCPSLEGIPKMFIMQACKGKKYTTLSIELGDKHLVPETTFSSRKIYPDMVIVYSTMEGKYSFRNTSLGGWLIQELCKNFSAYGRRDDVLTLLSRVSKCICKNHYVKSDTDEVLKQLPVVVSTLRKKFYLNKNKDRHFVLTTLERQDEVLTRLKSITTRVASIHGVDLKKM